VAKRRGGRGLRAAEGRSSARSHLRVVRIQAEGSGCEHRLAARIKPKVARHAAVEGPGRARAEGASAWATGRFGSPLSC
jgi:hypothetical protein